MINVVSIVEGDGEVRALPILLRRLSDWLSPGSLVHVPAPIRVRRDRFIQRDEEFRRVMLLAAAKAGAGGWVLVLLDADDDCPASLGAQLLRRAREVIPHRRVSVVLPNHEFEAWFIAAASSLEGQRGFTQPLGEAPVAAESRRGAKEWLGARMSVGYHETTDQPAFAASFDLQQAHDGSRSFQKLCKEWRLQTAGAPSEPVS